VDRLEGEVDEERGAAAVLLDHVDGLIREEGRRLPPRAGTRRFGPLSALQRYVIKSAMQNTALLWEALRPLNRPGWART
jgi:hypothetical protein